MCRNTQECAEICKNMQECATKCSLIMQGLQKKTLIIMRVSVSFRHSIRRSQTVNMNSLSVIKPHACHLYSKAFSRKYTLHRHVENMHAEEQSTDGEENNGMGYSHGLEYESLHKKRRCMSPDHSDESSGEDDSESGSEDNVESADDNDDEDDQSSSDLEDNIAYQDWLAEAKETTGDLWNMKYDKYTSEGMNEDQASEKANMKTQWAVKRNFFARFKDFLSSYLHLKDDEAYQDIVWDIEDKMEKGMDINKAISRIMAKHEAKFSALFEADEEYDEESSEEKES